MSLLKRFDHPSELRESFQVQQGRWLGCHGLRRGGVGRPTGGNRSMIAIQMSNDEIRIWTATHADDFHLLTKERMRGMRNREVSRTSWEYWGSVLWACAPTRIE